MKWMVICKVEVCVRVHEGGRGKRRELKMRLRGESGKGEPTQRCVKGRGHTFL